VLGDTRGAGLGWSGGGDCVAGGERQRRQEGYHQSASDTADHGERSACTQRHKATGSNHVSPSGSRAKTPQMDPHEDPNHRTANTRQQRPGPTRPRHPPAHAPGPYCRGQRGRGHGAAATVAAATAAAPHARRPHRPHGRVRRHADRRDDPHPTGRSRRNARTHTTRTVGARAAQGDGGQPRRLRRAGHPTVATDVLPPHPRSGRPAASRGTGHRCRAEECSKVVDLSSRTISSVLHTLPPKWIIYCAYFIVRGRRVQLHQPIAGKGALRRLH